MSLGHENVPVFFKLAKPTCCSCPVRYMAGMELSRNKQQTTRQPAKTIMPRLQQNGRLIAP
jgi:hypothetical protein